MTSSRQLFDVLRDWRDCEDTTQMQCEGARTAPPRSRAPFRKATLESTLETEIIPRLLLAHRVGTGVATPKQRQDARPSTDDVAEFVRLLLDHDTSIAFSYADALRSQGISVETLFLELVSPAARLLGELWKADVCDFTDVTIGLSRLQQLLHEMSPAFEDEAAREFSGRRLLLLPMPGEQHTLGVYMVQEFFRRAGWDCTAEAVQSIDEMAAMVRRNHYDVVGLSVGCESLLGAVPSAIQTIRKVSRNPGAVVMVGGQLLLDRPEIAVHVGADATAKDGRDAVMQLRSLLSPRHRELR